MSTVIAQGGDITVSTPAVPVVVTQSAGVVVNTDDGVSISLETSPVSVSIAATPVVFQVDEPSSVNVTVSEFAVTADATWPLRPDATLTWASNRLERVDYSDGSFKVLSYDANGRLETVTGEDAAGSPRTVTLNYSAGLLASVSRT